MRSGGSAWLLPARSFFIGGAGLAAAAWNPTNACPRLLCPFRSIVATSALPPTVAATVAALTLRGHFWGNPSVKRACLDSCLDSCQDKTTSSNFKFSSSLKFCCLDSPHPHPLNGMASKERKRHVDGWVAGWGVASAAPGVLSVSSSHDYET